MIAQINLKHKILRFSITECVYRPSSPAPVTASNSRQLPPLHFELDSVESSLQQMNVAVVGIDHQLAVGPVGIFVSADQEFQGELFEDVIVGGLEIVIGKRAENGAWFGDVLDEEFVGEVGEQRVHDGFCWYLPYIRITLTSAKRLSVSRD